MTTSNLGLLSLTLLFLSCGPTTPGETPPLAPKPGPVQPQQPLVIPKVPTKEMPKPSVDAGAVMSTPMPSAEAPINAPGFVVAVPAAASPITTPAAQPAQAPYDAGIFDALPPSDATPLPEPQPVTDAGETPSDGAVSLLPPARDAAPVVVGGR
jgi:hypothetical protein